MATARTLSLSALLALAVASGARAAPNDIKLQGLINVPENGAPTVRQDDFRLLVRDLGVIFTPSPLQPAETTGIAGFDFGIDYSFHPVSFGADYWQDAVEEKGNRLPMTIGARARKGFVLPIPLASEVDVGAQWLIDSQMVNLTANTRIALNEGFRYIPDLAVMAGVNRVVGSDDLDLVTVSVGGSVSKSFGVFGSFNLCPFVSYQSIFINGSTRIIDADPSNTSNVDDNVVFAIVPLNTNRVDRISPGFRVLFAHVMFSTGVDINLLGGNDVLIQYALRGGITF